MSNEDKVKYIDVTAKTSYNGEETPVHVNANEPLKLSSEKFDIFLLVRIKNYQYSKPEEESKVDHEKANEYFASPGHEYDSISIQFTVVFKENVNGADLLWGNDWDSPIRDILPWGFSAAFAIFKRLVDPGIDGDVYADKPYLYGPALSSINYMTTLKTSDDPKTFTGPIEEPNQKERHKKYLDRNQLKAFTFETGKTYSFDFSNPYLDMSTSPKIKMPGFEFDVGKYAGLTDLRYVLKEGDKLVFALVFRAVK